MIHHARRGTVSVEYIVLATLLAAVALTAGILPSAMGSMMIAAGDNMDASSTASTSPGATAAAPGAGTPTTTGGEGGGGWDGEDPWDGEPCKGNNGHGNNTDGVDVSNQGSGHGGPHGGVDPSGTIDDEKKGNPC